MNRIAMIVPYFGHFNNYSRLWLTSCSNNPQVDFLIFTDDAEFISGARTHEGGGISRCSLPRWRS